MAASPGRAVGEVRIDAPYPRDEAFRTSQPYNPYCREVSAQAARGHGQLMASSLSERSADTGAATGTTRPRPSRAPSASSASSASRRRSRSAAWRWRRGRRSSRSTPSRTTSCPARAWCSRSLIEDWGTLFPSLLITLQITFMALCVATIGGVGARDPVHDLEVDRAQLLPVRGDPAGDADHLDRAPDPDLCRQRLSGAPDLRLDRRVLPDPLQHDARPATAPTTTWSTCSSCMAPAAGRRSGTCACRRPCRTSWGASRSRAGCP